MNNNDQKFIAQKIRAQYMEKESTELDALRELDKKVRRPADILAYITGSLGAIVMGAGMSLTMTEIGAMIGMKETMLPGIVIGVAGMAMAVANYPLHKKILGSRRKKYADQIMELSDKLMKG